MDFNGKRCFVVFVCGLLCRRSGGMVQDDGRVEIRVNSSILSSVEPATKAVLDGMINSGFGTDLDVAFARADAGDEGSYTTYQTTALNGTAATASKHCRFLRRSIIWQTEARPN